MKPREASKPVGRSMNGEIDELVFRRGDPDGVEVRDGDAPGREHLRPQRHTEPSIGVEMELEIWSLRAHQMQMVMLAKRPCDLLRWVRDVVAHTRKRLGGSVEILFGDEQIDVRRAARGRSLVVAGGKERPLERDSRHRQRPVDALEHRDMARVVHLARERARLELRRKAALHEDAVRLPGIPDHAGDAVELGAREHLARACLDVSDSRK